MRKIIGATLLSLIFTTALPFPSLAETVLERIERTGVIRAGARQDAKPFGYINEQGEWVGYGIDILQLIRERLEKALDKSIELELVEVDTNNRFDLIMDREIDIECGSTTFTWNRDKYVDFSISYFVTGTQLLVRKGVSIDSPSDLVDKKIGVIEGTTNQAVIQVLLEPNLNLVFVKNHVEGLSKLENGEIDVYVSDGILLEGLRQTAANPDNWEIIPEQPISYESYACMIPENESSWRYMVNSSIMRAIQGLVIEDPEFVNMYNYWFGKDGVIPYPQDVLINHFQGVMNSLEMIPRNQF